MTTAMHRTPAEIEREVEEARARLRADLADMRTRLSPGAMLDHAIDYARTSGGAEFTRTFGRQVRDNPLPIALIGAGIGWLMTAGRLDGGARDDALDSRRMARGTAHGSFATEDAARWGIGDGIASAAHRAGDAATGAAHGVSEAAASVTAGVRGMGHRLGDGLDAGQHHLRDAASAVGDGLGRLIPEGTDRRVMKAVEDQPMILGALGIALGALVGAMLPRTAAEDRAFGDVADRVKGEASAAVRGGLDEAKSAARAAVDKAGEAVKDLGRAGLDGDGAATGPEDGLHPPQTAAGSDPEVRRPV